MDEEGIILDLKKMGEVASFSLQETLDMFPEFLEDNTVIVDGIVRKFNPETREYFDEEEQEWYPL